jgi:hypothetical protein
MAACSWVYLAKDAIQNSFRKPNLTSYFINAMRKDGLRKIIAKKNVMMNDE